MKNIKVFETENEYKSNENLVYPHVCLAQDTNKVFVKKEEKKLIKFGFKEFAWGSGEYLGCNLADPINSKPLYVEDGNEELTLFAEEGMTFEQWCNSEYNKFDDGTYYYYFCNDNCLVTTESATLGGSSSLNKNIVIENNAVYGWHYVGCC